MKTTWLSAASAGFPGRPSVSGSNIATQVADGQYRGEFSILILLAIVLSIELIRLRGLTGQPGTLRPVVSSPG
jgi:hypothetical protein